MCACPPAHAPFPANPCALGVTGSLQARQLLSAPLSRPSLLPSQNAHEVASRALMEASRNRVIEEEARLAREVSLLDSFLEDTLMGSLSSGAAPGHSAAVLQAHLAQARLPLPSCRAPCAVHPPQAGPSRRDGPPVVLVSQSRLLCCQTCGSEQ